MDLKVGKVSTIERKGIQPAGPGLIRGAPASSFKGCYCARAVEIREEKLKSLMDGIVKQGEALSAKADIYELHKYRKLVDEFIRTAVRSAFTVDVDRGFDRKGKYKEYSIVKKISDELDKLINDILDHQSDNIALLNRIDSIKGLLIDLMA